MYVCMYVCGHLLHLRPTVRPRLRCCSVRSEARGTVAHARLQLIEDASGVSQAAALWRVVLNECLYVCVCRHPRRPALLLERARCGCRPRRREIPRYNPSSHLRAEAHTTLILKYEHEEIFIECTYYTWRRQPSSRTRPRPLTHCRHNDEEQCRATAALLFEVGQVSQVVWASKSHAR